MILLILSILAYMLAGLLAGFISGLLGIGGGVIMVPSLYFLFYLFGYPQSYIMHLAIGTSLATMMLSSFASMRAHRKKNTVLWDVVKKMFGGITVGSILGAFVAGFISSVILEVIFGCFLMGLGVMFLKHRTPHLEQHRLPSWPVLSIFGIGIGGIANILGLGGGVFSVPLFTAFRMATKFAIGTSSALSFLMTTLGAMSYAVLDSSNIPIEGTFGFIHIFAFIFAGTAAFFAAPYGARCVGKFSDRKLKIIFGILLLCVGLSMAF